MANRSDYIYWYEALERSNVSRWVKPVAEAFGSAYGSKTFDDWWASCSRLFPRLERHPFNVLRSRRDYDDYVHHDEYELVVAFDLTSPKADLIAGLKRLLRDVHTGKAGRPQFEDWVEGDWELSGPTHNASYKKAFDVYDEHIKGDKPLWWIGWSLKVSPDGVPLFGERPDERQRNVLTAAASRHLAKARALIRGVEEGFFPALPSDFK